MKVFLATIEHLESLSILFDQYRLFYQQTSNIEATRNFLNERLQKLDSIIIVGSDNGGLIGFTQLYPSFSSVSMKKVWILNDLFVAEAHRKKGVATLLMNAAEKMARETGAIRVVLATQIGNTIAQKLYKSRGYAKDENFYHYTLQL